MVPTERQSAQSAGAIMKAIAEEGAGKLEYVVVVTDTEEPVSPCGDVPAGHWGIRHKRNQDSDDHPQGKRNWRYKFQTSNPTCFA
jgi:hypothetical protein